MESRTHLKTVKITLNIFAVHSKVFLNMGVGIIVLIDKPFIFFQKSLFKVLLKSQFELKGFKDWSEMKLYQVHTLDEPGHNANITYLL